MIIEECAYCNIETIMGTKKEHPTCNLFYKEENKGKLSYKFEFVPCEVIAIENCPYKLFCSKRIDAEELNKQIKQILDKKASKNEQF